jgi:hypothetical protein
MAAEELKPCPFCGKTPLLVKSYHSGCSENEETIVIRCENNNCHIKPTTGEVSSFRWLSHLETPDHQNNYVRIDSGERVIERWNRRAVAMGEKDFSHNTQIMPCGDCVRFAVCRERDFHCSLYVPKVS